MELDEEDKTLNYRCICATKKGFVVGGTQGKATPDDVGETASHFENSKRK